MNETKQEQSPEKLKGGTPKQPVKVEKVIKGPAKIKQKSKLSKLADTFIVEDISSVLTWAIKEVAIPSLKKLFVEFVDNTVNSMVYGRSDAEYSRRRGRMDNVSYRDYYDRNRGSKPVYPQASSDDVYSYGTLEVSTKAEAESVLNTMDDYISRYGMVTVGAFLEMAGFRPKSTDYNYGWTSISSAQIVRMRNGCYQIKMPKVMLIE